MKYNSIEAFVPSGSDFQSSREWGNEAETHQQRWMYSVIQSSSGTTLGTLVNVIHHDHTPFVCRMCPM